jgi:hypothetical protein
MRIASLVGRLQTGDLVNLGIADASTIDGLVAKYRVITEAGGKAKQGKQDIKLSEMWLLATNTGGGELKARRRFNPTLDVVV